MSCLTRFSAVLLVLATAASTPAVLAQPSVPDRVEFNRDIRPILSDVCFHCHGPDQAKRQGNLRFDVKESAFVDLGEGRHAIVPGKPESSELVRRITSTDPDLQMPPPDSDRKLTPNQIHLFRRWIQQGAKWDLHWSFVKPDRPKVPDVKNGYEAVTSPLDAFVNDKLQREQLRPSPPATKTTVLRRVTLDLTGLPPTPGDVRDYLADESPDAFERVVDRLLASPRYGERMAVRWLNAARYADTSGYQSDGERTMWRWRDWVIDAYSANMPFDQFTIEQLAGDLLANPTLDQRIATGFNRNHRGNAEGGIIPEEYACEYVVDRVETTATVWLGLTAMCARCHSHKYDPIAQADFYRLFAFFNNVPEKGRAIKYGNSPPYVASPTRDQQAELNRLTTQLRDAESAWVALQSETTAAQKQWECTDAPDLLAAEAIRRRLILHFPFDGNPDAAVSVPFVPTRPSGYLGQTRLLAAPATKGGAVETGDPRFAAGRFGQALDADGKHYAAVGDVANFGFFDKFSVAAWVRPSQAGGTIISRMTDVPHGDGWCIVLERGKLQVHLTKRWLDDACRVETASSIPSDDWTHVSVTYDGTREVSGIHIYLNGQPTQTVTILDELNQSFDNKGPLRIGAGNGPDGRFHGLIDEVRLFDRVVSDQEAGVLSQTDQLSSIAKVPSENRTPSQTAALSSYFVQNTTISSIRQAWEKLQLLKDAVAKFTEELPTTMVMVDTPVPRETHILIRGEYDKHGARVEADVLSIVNPLAADQPRNRLGLAQWLVDKQNPLTARVAVNRTWQMLFGTGLVKTVDDFGQQGAWPSHPELLDWLAVEFQRGSSPTIAQMPSVRAWDIKRLIRQIVTSSTYRQSSQSTEELQHRDPENRLLGRGPRFRLSAEMVRDQALAASGLLVEQLGGPSVKPYQPEGLWNDLAGLDYEQDHGPSLYRRSFYTYWKRTVAPPSMITFDAGGRETCIVKETRTNTPLQALNLLNDITYVEAARLIGERMMKTEGNSPARRITHAVQLILGREPSNDELNLLKSGYERHLKNYQEHPADAKSLIGIGEYPANPELNLPELATCTTIASMILNLDEAVTRE